MNQAMHFVEVFLSWPVILLAIVLLFRKQLQELLNRIANSTIDVNLGSFKLKLDEITEKSNQTADKLKKLNYLMAESRRLELEITSNMFGNIISEDQRREIEEHIQELKNFRLERG